MTSPLKSTPIRPFSGQTTPIVLSSSCDRWQPLVSPQGRWEGFHYMGVSLLLILMLLVQWDHLCFLVHDQGNRQTDTNADTESWSLNSSVKACAFKSRTRQGWVTADKRGKREKRTHKKSWEREQFNVKMKKVENKKIAVRVIIVIYYNV